MSPILNNSFKKINPVSIKILLFPSRNNCLNKSKKFFLVDNELNLITLIFFFLKKDIFFKLLDVVNRKVFLFLANVKRDNLFLSFNFLSIITRSGFKLFKPFILQFNKALSEFIEVDVSELKLGNSIMQTGLALPEGVELSNTLLIGQDQPVVSCTTTRASLEI